MGLFGGDSVIGLDVGSSTTKAVRMQVVRGNWAVVGVAVAPTPRGAVAEGMVGDAKALQPALQALLSQSSVRGSEVVAAINYTAAVSVRQAPLPVMTPEALRKQIQTEPGQFGLSGDREMIADFDILGYSGEGQEAAMNTVVAAAPRAPVEARVAALEAAGLDALAMDIEPLALVRALIECRPGRAERKASSAILDMGAGHTDVTVVRGSDYRFTRPIPFGGEGITEVVRQAVQCEVEQAEALKMEIDLRWVLDGPGDAADTPAYRATAAIKSVLDDLLKEVNNSILYFHAQLPEEDLEGMVDTIILTGGTSKMTGLVEYMQAAFPQRIERAEFPGDYAYPINCGNGGLSAEMAPIVALAMGLAAKEPMDRARAAAARSRAKRVAKPRKAPAAAA
ncbi:MAG: type IV pilus assembly protein PilM [Armatimonadetes bacterium]|nr:type IV pilus assembly protein PilM [Armatimonadota bacterium]